MVKVVGIFFCKILLPEDLTKISICTSYRSNTFRRLAEKLVLGGGYCVNTDSCYSDVHFNFRPLRVAVLTNLKECIFLNIHFENTHRQLFSKMVFTCAIWKPVTSSNRPINMHVLRQQQT